MDKENKSIKDIVDSVKKKADELYTTPISDIPKDKHGGINILPILFVLIIIILLMILFD